MLLAGTRWGTPRPATTTPTGSTARRCGSTGTEPSSSPICGGSCRTGRLPSFHPSIGRPTHWGDDVTFLGPDGVDWLAPDSRSFGWHLRGDAVGDDDVVVLANASWEPVEIALPEGVGPGSSTRHCRLPTTSAPWATPSPSTTPPTASPTGPPSSSSPADRPRSGGVHYRLIRWTGRCVVPAQARFSWCPGKFEKWSDACCGARVFGLHSTS